MTDVNMKPPLSKDQRIDLLMKARSPSQQLALRDHIKGEPDYYKIIVQVYLSNPVFRLTPDEVQFISTNVGPPAIRSLMLARDAASRSAAPKYSVFCMPKSGSSFVQSALKQALQLPLVSMTGFALPHLSSWFGMNSREQEIDELALAKCVLACPEGFIAQNHTRFSMYLAFQMHLYRITPIVTVRNILDCIVSFDDMMVEWRTGQGDSGWLTDAQFALPLNYLEMEDARRYELLARSFGIWLIGFYLSWKRCLRQNLLAPIFIRYEDDILDPHRFVELITSRISMTDEQRARLESYALNPDKEKSRFNVGRRGRGAEKIPEPVKALLEDHARLFAGELDEDEIGYLIRYPTAAQRSA